jgi:hypothetical protein
MSKRRIATPANIPLGKEGEGRASKRKFFTISLQTPPTALGFLKRSPSRQSVNWLSLTSVRGEKGIDIYSPRFCEIEVTVIMARVRMRFITGLILLLAILYIFVSPFLPGPLTALRAQQAADVFFFLVALYATVISAYLPLAVPTAVIEFLEDTFCFRNSVNQISPLRC